MASERQESLLRSRPVATLVLISLLGFTGFCFTLSALPTWAVQGGAGVGAAGTVTAVLLLSTVLGQLAVPWWTTRFGAGRVMAVGLLALGAPAPFYALSHDLRWLLALSVVRGVGFAILTVVGTLLTFALAPPGRHGEAVGLYGIAIAVPNLLAIPAGVALTQAGWFPWAAVLAGAPVLAVPLAWSLHAVAGPARPAAERSGPDAAGAGRWSAVAAVLSPSVVLLAVTVAVGGVLTVLPIERPDGQLAAAAVLLLGLTGAVTRWRVGALRDRVRGAWLLPTTVAVSGVGAALLAVGLGLGSGAGATVAVLVGAAVFGAGQGAVQNLTLVDAFALAGPERASTASAVWNVGFDAGTGLGAVAVGALSATALGFPLTMGVCAAVVACTLPLAVRSSRRAAAGRAR